MIWCLPTVCNDIVGATSNDLLFNVLADTYTYFWDIVRFNVNHKKSIKNNAIATIRLLVSFIQWTVIMNKKVTLFIYKDENVCLKDVLIIKIKW